MRKIPRGWLGHVPKILSKLGYICHSITMFSISNHVVKWTQSNCRECSGSVVECLTQDREAAGSSLTGFTALWSLSKTHLLYPATKVWRGIMLYLRCLSVCPSVRPCSPFPIDNLSIYSRNFFKFCIHIVIGDEWYGIVNGQNPSIFNGVTALFRIGKMVSGLLFLYCS